MTGGSKWGEAAALKKNLDRFIGVGLGTLLGQLVMRISYDLSPDIGQGDDQRVSFVLEGQNMPLHKRSRWDEYPYVTQ